MRAFFSDPLQDYLVRRSRRRFERVVREHASFVWNRALRVCGGHEPDAEDLVQDVFLRLLISPPAAKSVRHARSWLGWLVLSRAGHLREAGRRRLVREREAAQRRPAPSSPEAATVLRDAVDSLPRDLAEVVSLRYFAESSGSEVAGELGITESAVRKRLSRAREILSHRLAPGALASLTLGDGESVAGANLPPAIMDRLLSIADQGRALASLRHTIGSGSASLGLSRAAMAWTGGAVVLAVVAWLSVGAFRETQWRRTGEPAVSGPPATQSVAAPVVHADDALPETSNPETRAAPEDAVDELTGTEVSPAVDETTRDVPVLWGRVLSIDGTPLASVTVGVECETCDARAWTPRTTVDERTAPDGSFAFFDLPPGRYRLTSYSGGQASATERIDVPATEEVVLRLERAPHLTVRCLVARSGEPLADARIDYATRQEGGYGQRADRTDEGGEFAVREQPGTYEITLWSGTFRSETRNVKIPGKPPFPEIEVAFEEGVTLEGSALAADGSPLVSARVEWQRWNRHEYAARVTVADRDGRYRAEGLTPGRYWVRLDEHATPASRRQLVEVSSTPVQLRDLVFDACGDQEFVLLDADGSPVAEFPVECKVYSKTKGYSTGRTIVSDPTDADGRFIVRRICAGARFEFDLEDSELGALSANVTLSESADPVALRFAPWIVLEGRVEDPAGSPVESAEVHARSSVPARRYRAETTDADGRFRLSLWPGSYAVDARLDGHVRTRAHRVELSAGAASEPVVLTIEDLVSYRVRTVDASGAPIGGIRVFLETPEADRVTREDSSPEGVVELQALAGTYQVRRIYSPERYRAVPPLPTLSPETPEATLVVESQDDGLVEIPGVVLHEGAPVPGAWVRFVRHEGGRFGGHLLPRAFIAADENGRFTVRNKPGATMWIMAQGPGFAVACSELVTVPDQEPVPEVAVRSLAGDDLTVRVVDSDGRPMERVLLIIGRDGARWKDTGRPPCCSWGRTGADGEWVFARLPAGEYALDAQSIDGRLTAPRKTFAWPSGNSSIVVTLE